MLHHHVVEVSMESTSVYWIPIWRVLSPHFKLNFANPYFIKQIPGRKSDVKDAQWIAECTMKEHSRKCISPQDNHRVCMGSQQDEGLLLQPVLVPSDASEEKEQDEGPGGCGKKDAHRRLACVA